MHVVSKQIIKNYFFTCNLFFIYRRCYPRICT